MIEQYLQVALELFKEIWFQLDSILGIEETETFKLIKPYFLELQDNITYMGIALAMLTLIPLVLHKARSIARVRERNMEKLMEDMDEEEYDNINLDTQKVMGNDEEEFKLEAIGPELAKSNLNKDVAEFKRFDFDSQGNVIQLAWMCEGCNEPLRWDDCVAAADFDISSEYLEQIGNCPDHRAVSSTQCFAFIVRRAACPFKYIFAAAVDQI